MRFISITLLVLKLESSNFIKEEQAANIKLMSVTLLVIRLEVFNSCKE